MKVKKYKKDVTRDVKRLIPDQRRIRKRLKFGIRNFRVQFICLFILRTIYLFILFIYLFCVVIKYFIRAYGDKVKSASIVRAPTFTLDDVYNCTI